MINQIIKALKKYNNEVPHQQDQIQWYGGVARCLCQGTHGSAPHLTKTLILFDENGDYYDINRRSTEVSSNKN